MDGEKKSKIKLVRDHYHAYWDTVLEQVPLPVSIFQKQETHPFVAGHLEESCMLWWMRNHPHWTEEVVVQAARSGFRRLIVPHELLDTYSTEEDLEHLRDKTDCNAIRIIIPANVAVREEEDNEQLAATSWLCEMMHNMAVVSQRERTGRRDFQINLTRSAEMPWSPVQVASQKILMEGTPHRVAEARWVEFAMGEMYKSVRNTVPINLQEEFMIIGQAKVSDGFRNQWFLREVEGQE